MSVLARCVAALALLLLAGSGVWAVDQPSTYSGVCPSGAQARKEAYCHLFTHYASDAKPGSLDFRIADNLGVMRSDQTRSIALVIAIGAYPNHPGYELPAAKVDGDNLERFLVVDQKFDEVIMLRDGDATVGNIDYFLDDYIPNRAGGFGNKARILIAFSGHGRPDTGAQQAAFLLGAIDDVNGTDNVYLMERFSRSVQKLATVSFHVLTLVNACYGGSFFTSATPGGDPDKMSLPGSYAMTAGSTDREVPSLDAKRGSLFFDLVVDGVQRGWADPLYWEDYASRDGNGQPIRQNGLTRLSALKTYVSSSYDLIDRAKAKDKSFQPLVSPWFGAAQSGVALGGFFLLSDTQTGKASDLAEAYVKGTSQPLVFGIPPAPLAPTLAVPAGPVSSIPGRPDIKVFKPAEVYPIKGFDFSSAEAAIDWPAFVNAAHPRFLYARALGWRGADSTFQNRWGNAKEFGVDRGAYVKFDFCRSVPDQIASLKEMLPPDPAALPLALELVTPTADQDRDQGVHQLPCYTAMGVPKAKEAVLEYARRAREIYGKVPLFFGNQYNLSVLTDERSDAEMIWLGAYTRDTTGLKGRNPWTLWQYSGNMTVKGVGDGVTGSVFFGNEAQYAAFKAGQENVALRAVQR